MECGLTVTTFGCWRVGFVGSESAGARVASVPGFELGWVPTALYLANLAQDRLDEVGRGGSSDDRQ